MTTFDELSTSEQGNYDFWTKTARYRLAFTGKHNDVCPHYRLQSEQSWKACKQALRNRAAKKWLATCDHFGQF